MKEYNGSSYDTLYPKNISGQVILDSTALSILNLPANSTANDAFNHLANGGAFNVGDILVTSRTDMDDTWLLCNGENVNESDYPDLGNVLSVIFTGTWFSGRTFPTSSNYTYSHSLVKLGEKWGLLSTNKQTSPGSATNGRVFILDNLRGSNITDTGLSARVNGISEQLATYVNDDKSLIGMGMAFTDLLTNPASSTIYISNGKVIYNSNDGYYYNYVLRESSPFYVMVRRNNLTSSASTLTIELSSELKNGGLTQYINGNMIGVSCVGSGVNVRFITNLVKEDGTVTSIAYDTPSGYGDTTPPRPSIQYLNGYYYGFGSTTIYRRQSLTTGSWEAWKAMPGGINSGLSYMGNNCILLTSGYTVTADEQLVEWSDKPTFSNSIYIDDANGVYISQIGYSKEYRYTPITSFIKLPTWSPADGLYAYIKAKK